MLIPSALSPRSGARLRFCGAWWGSRSFRAREMVRRATFDCKTRWFCYLFVSKTFWRLLGALGASWVPPGCLLGASWVSPGCLQMPPRCLPDGSQILPRCLPDDSQKLESPQQGFHSRDSTAGIPQQIFHSKDFTARIPQQGFRNRDSPAEKPQQGFHRNASTARIPQ